MGQPPSLSQLGRFASIGLTGRIESYLPIAALPLLFGLQQFSEGIVWVAGAQNNIALITWASLVYMFFSWLTWPVWIPVSTYFLEPAQRKPLYLGFAILGAMLGGLQYFPYFAHQGWLETKFLEHLIMYQGKELLDFFVGREIAYLIYAKVVIGPLLLSSARDVRIFGGLAALVLAATFIFFSYAYVSVFCFAGALMSAYLVWMIFCGRKRPGWAEDLGDGKAQNSDFVDKVAV